MNRCDTCDKPATADRLLIPVVDEDGGYAMCQMCVIRLVGTLARCPVGVALVLIDPVTVG